MTTDALFVKSDHLEDDPSTQTPGDGDLYKLEQTLIGLRATYRIFSSNVIIRGAKWSKALSP